MKYQKLLIIAAAACLLAAFVSGPAQADTQRIVDDYCDDVALTVDVSEQKLIDAYKQGVECFDEFQSCMLDLIRFDSASRCFNSFSQCAKRGQRAQLSACSGLLHGLQDATKSAERSAKRSDDVVEFNLWLQGDSSIDPTSGECLVDAYGLTEECFE